MSKSSQTTVAGSKSSESTPSKSKKPHHGHHQDASRETLESIAFAFVLALLFRTFVAEAFVIPTGSMAPTLFGRNKDVACTECQYKYQVGASEEVDDDGYLRLRIEDSICPNCRHMNKIHDLPVFKGDRILVNKFPYQVGKPERWDVIVFRYPEDSQKNYIKRLVGLPGETIRISRGDVYARRGNHGEFQILRKQNPYKQKVLQQLVYDDRHPPVDLLAKGWPERLTPMKQTDPGTPGGWVRDEAGWRQDAKSRRFSIEETAEPKWVRYQHFVPEQGDWSSAETNDFSNATQPQLITDFCGYNMYTGGLHNNLGDDRYWVGDLTLNLTIEITSAKGAAELSLELVEGVRRYRCRIDVSTGQATLLRNDDLAADSSALEVEMATAPTPIRGPGKYTMTFANVDDRLCLWVNSNWLNSGLIPFGTGAEFSAPPNRHPQPADLVPVGFATKGISAHISDVIIERDIYYRAENVPNESSGYTNSTPEVPDSIQLQQVLGDPVTYGDLYSRNSREVEFRGLGSDEFFVMGDNSPRSMDSRLWPNSRKRINRHAVPRQALLGKAFFIYWPHGIPFLNNGKGFNVLSHSVDRQNGHPAVETYPEYSVPFYPQWWRWKRIR